MSQQISRKDLHTLYEAVKNCSTWKTKIEQTLVAQQLNDKIEVEDSVINEAYSAANDAQKKLLTKFFTIKTPKKIIEQIKDLKDVFRLTGKKQTDVLPYKKPANKAQKSQNALALIQVITEAYNQGEIPDFSNREQRKHFIWWEKNSSGAWVLYVVYYCYFNACLGFGCYFLSEEAALDAAKKFKQVFLDYLPD